MFLSDSFCNFSAIRQEHDKTSDGTTTKTLNCLKMIIGSSIITLGSTSSTNSHARKLLRKKAAPPDGCVIRTGYQSAGRGQQGNSWESERDCNLLLSVIVYPDMLNPSDQFLLSMSVSMGITDFLSLHDIESTIKWPNDIYTGDRKIAGILIENAVQGSSIENSIIGIGLNVNQQRFVGNAPNPVSMSMLTGISYDTGSCFSELLTSLDRRYKNLIRGDFSEIRTEYLRSLYHSGEWHDYMTDGKVFRGRIASVSNTGLLVIEELSGKLSEFAFKEVDYLIPGLSSL